MDIEQKIAEVNFKVNTGEYFRKRPETRGTAWDVFLKTYDTSTKSEIKDGKFGYYYCTLCQQTFRKDITNGSSTLTTHIGTCKRKGVC